MDTATKKAIKKDRFGTCGYIYRDGIAIMWKDKHTYKGETFEKERSATFPQEIRISSNTEEFTGRLVIHNATLLLDGIEWIEIYRNNSSQSMKEKGLTCDTVTLHTKSGMRIQENIFPFISADICIQNDRTLNLMMDWPASV